MPTADTVTASMWELLDTASQLMVGVTTRSGPHTTPELFATSAGRIWCMTAASTLKAGVLRDGGAVAAAATVGSRSVVIKGSATVVDAARLLDPLRSPLTSALAPLAMGRYATKNAAELSGAVVDALTGKLGWPVPPRRVVLAIDPEAAALVDHDEVVGSSGVPGPAPGVGAVRGGEDLVEGIPEELHRYASSGPAFAGWTTEAGGPLVLPGSWSLEDRSFRLPGTLMEWAGGVAEGRASVTRDGWTGFGPTGKEGLMLRGDGRATTDGALTAIALDVTGVTYWDGIQTGTVTGAN